MIYRAFDKQAEFHKDKSRFRLAAAGKRCINPRTIVLSQDGLKEFGDVSEKDRVLSFDQRDNAFQISQTNGAFPKTKEIGYRVIHEQGEFVASGHHRILLSTGEYLSILDIIASFVGEGPTIELVSIFQSQPLTTLGIYLKELSVDAHHSIQKPLNYSDHCENGIRQYGQLPRDRTTCDQFSIQRPLYVQEFDRFSSYHQPFEINKNLLYTASKHNHLYQWSDRSNLDLKVLATGLNDFEQTRQRGVNTFLQSPDLHRATEPPQRYFYGQHKVGKTGLLKKELQKAFYTCKSRILAIEQESTQWFWDIEVPGDNNYVAGGAIHHNSGKSECGAVEAVIHAEARPNWKPNGIDPYLGVIIAPTTDMLRRLSLMKFFAYAAPFNPGYHKTHQEITWPNGSKVYAISADKPQRLEGVKANFIWIDEVFQVSEQLFLEAMARVSDQKGRIWCTGSLGVQYQNPKKHWAHRYFKERKDPDFKIFEWTTSDNPYFPRDELIDLKNRLDPRTYRQMFEIDWGVPGTALVFDTFSEANLIKGIQVKPEWEISVSIDWGWAHEMACLFFAYDQKNEIVYLFDEIVGSKITLEQLHSRIMAKRYKIAQWYCDIAGNQEREQTGLSNVAWFRRRNIYFKYRRTPVQYGIMLMRSFIRAGDGTTRFYIDETRCPKSVDAFMTYSYPEKDGVIINENPIKKADDVNDAARYYFVNRLDKTYLEPTMTNFNRWGEWKF